MKKYILISLLSVLQFNCKNTNTENKLQGIWCQENGGYCLYFTENECNVNSGDFHKYEIEEDILVLFNREDSYSPIEEFEYEIKERTLGLRTKGVAEFVDFYRSKKINKKSIEKIYYAVDAEGYTFNAIVDSKGELELDIVHFFGIKSGKYKGEIKPVHVGMLNEILKTVSLNVKPNLDSKIVSDIEEWAMILIDDKGKEYPLYYNYKGTRNEHHSLSKFMGMLPHVIIEENEETALSENKARAFKEEEFKRNLEMQK